MMVEAEIFFGRPCQSSVRFGFQSGKLCQNLEVNPRTVNLCFQEKSKPSRRNLVKLAKILNIDPLELSKLFMNLKK